MVSLPTLLFVRGQDLRVGIASAFAKQENTFWPLDVIGGIKPNLDDHIVDDVKHSFHKVTGVSPCSLVL